MLTRQKIASRAALDHDFFLAETNCRKGSGLQSLEQSAGSAKRASADIGITEAMPFASGSSVTLKVLTCISHKGSSRQAKEREARIASASELAFSERAA